jgi:RNA polymerase sigma-70 factor (ECF subfamily)
MGLTALLLLQHARAPARFDADGAVVLLEDQDRSLWNGRMIAEGLALIDKAVRHRRPGPYLVQAAIAAEHDRAERPEDTDWARIDLLYGDLEQLAPSPVVTLNRAVAVSKVRRTRGGPGDDRAAGIFNMEKMVGPDFEKGLASLKVGAET